MTMLAFIVLAYLIGSVSFAVIVSAAFRLPDPRSYGSKNPGATNVLRSGKKIAAALTLMGDAFKGWLAVFLAKYGASFFDVNDLTVAAVALAVIIGHIWPIFFRFEGGKGVATALGVLLALDFMLGLTILSTWLVVFMLFRISALAAISAALVSPLLAAYFLERGIYTVTILILMALLIWRHKSNIVGLLQRKEDKVEVKMVVK